MNKIKDKNLEVEMVSFQPAKRIARLEARCMKLTREVEERKEVIRVAQHELRERTARMG